MLGQDRKEYKNQKTPDFEHRVLLEKSKIYVATERAQVIATEAKKRLAESLEERCSESILTDAKTNLLKKVCDGSFFDVVVEISLSYIDKTRFIEKLLTKRETRPFFSFVRPRRFGKTLFLNTLACFFEKERSYFAGLDAGKLDENDPLYRRRPVVKLNLASLTPCKNENDWRNSMNLIVEDGLNFRLKCKQANFTLLSLIIPIRHVIICLN